LEIASLPYNGLQGIKTTMQKLNIEMRQVFQSLLDEHKKGRSISEKDDEGERTMHIGDILACKGMTSYCHEGF
jgi:hypothetical protein